MVLAEPPRRSHTFQRAVTLVELLLVIAIISLLLGALSVSPALLFINRRMVALQQISALLDEARAQALRGKGPVYVVFAPVSMGDSDQLQPCRQYAIFHENEDQKPTQASHWHVLPDSLIFDPDAVPSVDGMWTNLFQYPTDEWLEFTIGNRQTLTAPAIGFDKLGSVIHPVAYSGPIGLVIAEGHVSQGQVHLTNPHSSLSLEVRRHTGKTLIHP